MNRSDMKRRRNCPPFSAFLILTALHCLCLASWSHALSLDRCIVYLSFSDRDEDSQLSRHEYTHFANQISPDNNFMDMFLEPFDSLPPRMRDNFDELSCHCREGIACCSPAKAQNNNNTIDVFGVHSEGDGSMSRYQEEWVWGICNRTEAAIEQGLLHDSVQVVVTSRQQLSTPAPTPTMSQCYISMALSDDGNEKLSQQEYVSFINALGDNNWSGEGFSSIPEELQQVFTNRATNDAINITGSLPGEQTSAEQNAFLDDFCTTTFLAISSEVVGDFNISKATPVTTDRLPRRTMPPAPTTLTGSAQLPSSAPAQARTSAPEPTVVPLGTEAPVPASPMQSSGLSDTPGPTIAYNTCVLSMAINDSDGNKFLGPNEFFAFLNQVSGRKFTGLSFSELPQELQNLYQDLSTGDNGVNILGSLPGSDASDAQTAFLEQACIDVGLAINSALSPGDTPAPSPIPITAAPTISPTTPVIVARPSTPPARTPISEPSIITRFPFSLTSPTQPPTTLSPVVPPSVAPTVMPQETPVSSPPTLSPTTGVPASSVPSTNPSAGLTVFPISLPPTLAPTPNITMLPTLKPTTVKPTTITPTTMRPTTRKPSSQMPSVSPSSQPSRSSTGSLSPSIHPEGVLTFGEVTFLISNSMRLDQDHLRSGERRYHLDMAFNNLAQNVTAEELGQRRLRQRRLNVWFAHGKVTNVTNAPCPPDVMEGTLCATCIAQFALESINEGSLNTRVQAIETELNAAIQNGELQQELDAIAPDTPLRIEEGTVRKREAPVGYYNVGGISPVTMAIIGVGIFFGVIVLYCMWNFFCCIQVPKAPEKMRLDPGEGPKSKGKKQSTKPQGWFG